MSILPSESDESSTRRRKKTKTFHQPKRDETNYYDYYLCVNYISIRRVKLVLYGQTEVCDWTAVCHDRHMAAHNSNVSAMESGNAMKCN